MVGGSKDEGGGGGAPFRVVASAVALVVSSAGAAYAAIDLVSTEDPPDPPDPDYLWEPWLPLAENTTLVGAISAVVFVGALGVFASAVRSSQAKRPLAAQVAVMSGFAMWLGAGYGIVTDGVAGANIGGGGVLLLTPVVALFTLALVGGIALAERRATRSP
jgi:hypothetical protein